MDIGQPRPTSASIQQNAGNNPVVTQEANRAHHQQSTSQKIHDSDKVRISPDARDYLKREKELAETQLKTKTRQFSGVEHSPEDQKVMNNLQRLSNSSDLDTDAVQGVGMFEIEGMEPIIAIVGDFTVEQQQNLIAKVRQDEQMLDSLRELPGKPLPQEAVQEILPALSSDNSDIQKVTNVLMRLMLEDLQGQLQQLNQPEKSDQLPDMSNLTPIESQNQQQRLKASIFSVESQLASWENRRLRQDIVSGS